MRLEYELASSIISTENFAMLFAVDTQYIVIPEVKRLLEYTLNYCQEYRKFPTKSMINEQFPDLILQPTDKHAEYVYDRVKDEYSVERIVRTIQDVANLVKQKAQRPLEITAKGIIAQVIQQLSSLPVNNVGATASDIKELVGEVLDDVKMRQESYGVPERKLGFGIPTIDALGPGIKEGNLITVQGRSGTGKTFFITYMCSVLWNEFLEHKPLVISLEMNKKELTERFLSLLVKTSFHKMQSGLLSREEFDDFTLKIKNTVQNSTNRLVIYDPSTANELTVKAAIERYKPTIVFIDHMELLTYSQFTKSKVEALDKLAYILKGYAKEYNIPIVMVAQTNRDGLKFSKPGLEHLRGSDAIGQASDISVALYTNDTFREEQKMGFSVVKYRNGSLGEFVLNWNFGTMDIGSLSGSAPSETVSVQNKKKDVEIKPMGSGVRQEDFNNDFVEAIL